MLITLFPLDSDFFWKFFLCSCKFSTVNSFWKKRCISESNIQPVVFCWFTVSQFGYCDMDSSVSGFSSHNCSIIWEAHWSKEKCKVINPQMCTIFSHLRACAYTENIPVVFLYMWTEFQFRLSSSTRLTGVNCISLLCQDLKPYSLPFDCSGWWYLHMRSPTPCQCPTNFWNPGYVWSTELDHTFKYMHVIHLFFPKVLGASQLESFMLSTPSLLRKEVLNASFVL